MKRRSSGGCSSFLLMLFLLFVILKVIGAVAWSWWWVASPLWMPAAFLLTGLLIAALLGVSVYKIAAAALRRQGFGRTGGPGPERSGADRSTGDILEAQGSEVSPPAHIQTPAGLPAATHSEADEVEHLSS